MKTIYLDNAATTPIAPEVTEAMLPYLKEEFGNPSSIHQLGNRTRVAIEQARKKVAELLNAHPSEIFFTSGGTEADNMALVQSVLDLGVKEIISTPIEHHAVEHTIQALEKRGWIKARWLSVNQYGQIDLDELENLLKNQNGKTLVSIMHANNEIGTLNPLKRIGELCKKYDAYFHSDTVQTVGHFKIDLQNTPVDFIAASAHKFHGPKGVGFIYINRNLKIKPFINGGAQERNMRGGTENVAGIVGLAKALELAYQHLDDDMAYISKLKNYMIEQLSKHIPDMQFNGLTNEKALYTVLNCSFPPHPQGMMFLYKLDIAGICASAGSACSSGSNVGSHVLKAIGASSDRHAVRFSFSKYNTKDEIDEVVKVMKEIYETVKV
ncbi:MAG: cysteine desulfurase family protein [Bacteroidota bacterium]